MSEINVLLDKFKSGMTPTGSDFKELIESSFNNNIEVYTTSGLQTRTVKLFVGNTTVNNNNGEWEINFSNVGYRGVFLVLSSPIQNGTIDDIKKACLTSVVHRHDNQNASGVSFNASVINYPNSSGVSLSPQGTNIQVVVIGY